MVAKRAFDLAASAVLLTLLLPLCALVALLVVASSGPPVLHKAVRAGRQGREFHMLKFRTMNVAPGSHLTGPDDPRVTSVGRLLRRLRLDEVPQLLNVLRGEMSLVGPRPEDPEFVASYTPRQREVLSVRPGLTSPAAVRYRNESVLLPAQPERRAHVYLTQVLPRKLELDLEYIRRRTFWGDVAILGQTVGAVFLRREPKSGREPCDEQDHTEQRG